MLEYLFFDERVRDKFGQYLKQQGVECRYSDEDGLVALIPEDLPDTIGDAIDEEFERLLQETAALLEDEAIDKSAAGVRVLLSDGTPCQVRLNPELMARMLNCISLEELRDLVQDVALAVEHPDDNPICHTP